MQAQTSDPRDTEMKEQRRPVAVHGPQPSPELCGPELSPGMDPRPALSLKAVKSVEDSSLTHTITRRKSVDFPKLLLNRPFAEF